MVFPKFVTKAALIALCVSFSLSTSSAKDVPPAKLKEVLEAVKLMHVDEIFKVRSKMEATKMVANKTLRETEVEKFNSLFAAEVDGAINRINDRLAKKHAQIIPDSQVRDILLLQRHPAWQMVLTATLHQRPVDKSFQISKADQDFIEQVTSSPLYDSFAKDVSNDGGNFERDLAILMKRAMTKLKAK